MTFPQVEKMENIKPESGPHQVGTKLESLKTLKYCTRSKSFIKFMALFEIKDRTKF